MNKERIVCAAIKINWTDNLGLEHQEILCGIDYKAIRNIGFYKDLKTGEFWESFRSEKGFITNNGEFVLPDQAEIIAGLAGQIRNIKNGQIVEPQHYQTFKDHPVETPYYNVLLIGEKASVNEDVPIHTIGRGLTPEDLA